MLPALPGTANIRHRADQFAGPRDATGRGVPDGGAELTRNAQITPGNGRVRVVTDSAASLDPPVAAAYRVHIVPMAVDSETQPLGGAAVSAHNLPAGGVRTSAPSPGKFLAAITEPPAPAGVVIVTVAAALFAAHGAATLAARLSASAGGPPVEVVDSGSVAGGQALVTLAAAQAAASGLPASAVAQAARGATAGVRLLAVVGSLDSLMRGGRLAGVVGTAGRLAGVHPLFELRFGQVRPLRPAFSRSAAMDRLAAAFRRDLRADAIVEIAVSHASAASDAQDLLERVSMYTSPALAIVGGLGAAMLAHTGVGTLGLAWRWHPPP
jgi:DegV family protein with EDD domain